MEATITSPDDIVETLLFALELRNAESAAHERGVHRERRSHDGR